jgi:GTP-binding protein HflX
MQVNGQIDGLKKSYLDALELIYDIKVPKEQLFTMEMVSVLAEITSLTNREIAVYIDRRGSVLDVRVGDSKTVALVQADARRKEAGLSGVLCVHTHPGGNSTLSDLDISTLKQLRLDMMIAVGVKNSQITGVSVAIPDESLKSTELYGPFHPMQHELHELRELILERDKPGKELAVVWDDGFEKALLVGLETPQTPIIEGISEAEISMRELKELARTAGAYVVDAIVQKRAVKDAACLVGRGKLEEISQIVQTKEIDILIFDEELSSSQIRNIEEATRTKVVDRTGLILDIFAGRAKSKEGRVQVELAQLNYMLPRLSGYGTAMSRLGGGIGTRGPGETKLETDRRHIRRRIDYLKDQLDEIKGQRQTVRREREKNKMPLVSLVGYTNSGKSTLLNALCSADVFAEDKLFATLDTTTRKLELEDNFTVLLSDTVGFIRKLPHHLVEAFKATLEEAVLSDLIVIVADVSAPFSSDHIHVVDNILNDLGATGKPSLIVWNKWDKMDGDFRTPYMNDKREEIQISALTGEGLEELKAMIKKMLEPKTEQVTLKVPFTQGWVLPYLYENGVVKEVDYIDDSSLIKAEMVTKSISRVKSFIVE